MDLAKLMPVPVAPVKNELKSNDDTSEEKISPAEKLPFPKRLKKEEVKKDIKTEIQNEASNSSLNAAKTFNDLQLKPTLLKGICAMGFKTPSKIQWATLPALLADPPRDVIAQSQYGTGKTVACILAMLNRVDPTKEYPQVIYLKPKLGVQIGELESKISHFCPEIKIKYTTDQKRISLETITEHIIIGTPGKVFQWGKDFKVFDLSKISVFALNGGELLMKPNRRNQCLRVYELLPRTCQVMVFSMCQPEVMCFAKTIVRNPLIVQLSGKESMISGRKSLDSIKQYFMRCKDVYDKYRIVINIYGLLTIGQAIVICNKRRTADWLAAKMRKVGFAIMTLLAGDVAAQVLDRFKTEHVKILITTSNFVRDMYVEQVRIVINFDLPKKWNKEKNNDMYLRRISKTGQFGNSGIIINLIESQRIMRSCKKIGRYLGTQIHYLDANDADEFKKIELIANYAADV